MRYYILDINHQPGEVHKATWEAINDLKPPMQDISSYIVGNDIIRGCHVCTWFVGTSETMFETNFLDGDCPTVDDGEESTYLTYEEAERGHAEIVAAVRAATKAGAADADA